MSVPNENLQQAIQFDVKGISVGFLESRAIVLVMMDSTCTVCIIPK